MINYQEIIDELQEDKIKILLDNLNIPFEDKGTYLLMPTVCHNESIENASWKLYYYKNTHLFMCYTECGGMNIFKFLKNFYEAHGIEYDWYNDILQVILTCSARDLKKVNGYKSHRDKYELKKNRKELPEYSKGIMDCFTKFYTPEWLNDGIEKKTMEKYNIRYSISQNKIIIPHYDINDRLIGIRGRALNEQDIENFGKYMPVQIENKWYSHPLSLNLYGLNKTKDNIKKSGVAYIFESEKSVLQFESFDTLNCAVASCGSNINKFQIDLLIRYCAPHEIVICYDKEEEKGEEKYFNKLWNFCKKYETYCNMSFIYDRENIIGQKDSPSDRGEKKFLELLKRRIIVK